MRTLRFIARGRVQGVGYRAWAVRTALALGVDGWVRNRNDGRVEIVLRAPSELAEQFIAACRNGPRHAEVMELICEEYGESVPSGFSERPSV